MGRAMIGVLAGTEWDQVAPAWEELHDHTEASVTSVTERLLTLLEPRPGETVLELGCGIGSLGLRIADLVRPGDVIVSDIAEGMVAAARRRLSRAARPNAEVRVLDGQEIDLPADCVDVVVSRMGYMLMPDAERAFAEARRVLRSDSRLVFSVWSAPQHNAWAALLGMAVLQAGLDGGGDPFAPGGVFSLSDETKLRALLSAAGFSAVQIEEVDSPHVFSDIESYWVVMSRLAGPLAVRLAATPREKVEEVKRNVVALASQYEGATGLILPGRALVVRAS